MAQAMRRSYELPRFTKQSQSSRSRWIRPFLIGLCTLGVPGCSRGVDDHPGSHRSYGVGEIRDLSLAVTAVVDLDEPHGALLVRPSAALLVGAELVVVDQAAGDLKIYSQAGTLQRVAGRYGRGPGEFRSPITLTRVGDRVVGVADLSNRKIVQMGVDDDSLAETHMPEGLMLGYAYNGVYHGVLRRIPAAAGRWQDILLVWQDSIENARAIVISGAGVDRPSRPIEAVSAWPHISSSAAGHFCIASEYNDLILVVDKDLNIREVAVPALAGRLPPPSAYSTYRLWRQTHPVPTRVAYCGDEVMIVYLTTWANAARDRNQYITIASDTSKGLTLMVPSLHMLGETDGTIIFVDDDAIPRSVNLARRVAR
jgi:hypothetical protein